MTLTLDIDKPARERLRRRAQRNGIPVEQAERKVIQAAQNPPKSQWEVLGFILLLALSNAISPAVDHAIMDNFQPMVDHLIKHGTEEQLAALLPMEDETRDLRHDPPGPPHGPPAEPLPDPTGKAKALFDLLQQWRDEDAAMSPEEQAEADRDLDEFKRNINANRAATGEEPVY